MAGRFLELGLATPDILESLHFYRTLGFTELAVGEVWPHKYAVVTDGTLSLGLHEDPVASPVVTLVQPSLRRHVLSLQDTGTDFEKTCLGEDEFNHAVLRDPDGTAVMLVEARTYSPAPETPDPSLLGACLEVALPVRDALAAAHFWAPLAPRLAAYREEPEPRFRLAVDDLVLGLGARPALAQPLLVYRVDDAPALQAAFDRLGVFPGSGPDLPAESWGTLRSPEGTDIGLMKADYWPD